MKLSIPKEIIKKITSFGHSGRTDYYGYFEVQNKKLAISSIAVKQFKDKLLIKKVAVHIMEDQKAFVSSDCEFKYLAGYVTSFNNAKNQNKKVVINCYDDNEFWEARYDLFRLYWDILNKDFVFSLDKYKYCAYDGKSDILKYLEKYDKEPKIELVTKLLNSDYATKTPFVKKINNDVKFRKYVMDKAKEIKSKHYNTVVIRWAFDNNVSFETASSVLKLSRTLNDISFYELQSIDKNKLINYLIKQDINLESYTDYIRACQYLQLDMSLEKNLFPHDFKRWHDIRIDEYRTAQALKDEQERKELYDKFKAVAEKYMALEKTNSSSYLAIIAKSPKDLIHEGDVLHHCVGKMNYDQKFVREESLIFFIRKIEEPEKPLVTVEYSPTKHKVLQCYGEKDSKPNEEIQKFVDITWLQYANKQIKQIAS